MDITYLVGIKHSGKSSVGRAAAKLLGIRFVDTDDLVKHMLPDGIDSIRQLYRESGKERFMALELLSVSTYISSLVDSRYLIATGGGVCDNDELLLLMRRTGKIIYLSVEEQVLYRRIVARGLPPFLDTDDPRTTFSLLFCERDARYRQISDYVLSLSDYRSVPENARILAECLRKLTGSEEPCREIPLELH